ncbi:WD repeat-containing protein 13 [Parasteatoda tepidariorum]|uniref:WD repeat-containing protein 13 n=1 Tax=Parasteatoda tepidariorum TaxID=114398 RepID=UPI001C72716F|nr:WD repeat-containing protein 13 isoform X1 [Parasteatoda tepidariorum]XP_042910128.1 WD repeat-containing protein 13 isoform X2 [Parasteatoda tepidariorum]
MRKQLNNFASLEHKMASVWQQILAVDARYNAYRAPSNPQFRTLYIRRRSQLLRENAKQEFSPVARKQYLRLRNQLLSQRYGVCLDQTSVRSQSMSARSNSRATLETSDSFENRIALGDLKKVPRRLTNEEVVPTHLAEASRALVGGTSIDENYAFTGVHHIFDQHKDAVTAVRFANNDKSLLACSSLDGKLSICQLTPPPASVLYVLSGHKAGLTAFEWSISNDLILTCSLDATVRLWDTALGLCIRVVEDPFGAPLLCCAFQPYNNNMVVIGNSKGMVQVLNVSTGIYLKGGSSKSSGSVLSIVFDPSGRLLWAGNDKGYILSFLFDLHTGRLTKGRKILVSENNAITCLSARSWANREARDPLLLVNCASDAVFLFSILRKDGSLELKRKFPIRHSSQLAMIRSSFCPIMSFRQGTCIVSGSEDTSVYFFDLERERKACVNKLQGHSATVIDVCFNYDESLLASSDASGMVIIWKRSFQT